MWDYHYYYWGMNWIWWILWLLLIIWIFALPVGIPGQRHHREGPLDILKKRFARGEIDQKEYQERKAELEKK
jgi:putative membrane protein